MFRRAEKTTGAMRSGGSVRVYDGWWTCGALDEFEEQEGTTDRYSARNPITVDRSDAAIAREMIKVVRRSVERHGGTRRGRPRE